jgi:hypothetical protein
MPILYSPPSLHLSRERDLCVIDALAAETDLSGLTHLYLNYCEASDLAPIAALGALTHLHMFSCQRLRDFGPLAALPTLTTLQVTFSHHVQDLSALADVQTLTTLTLHYCQGVRDLRPLARLSRLTTLDLSYCKQLRVRDLSRLADLPHLSSLDLRGCGRTIPRQPPARPGWAPAAHSYPVGQPPARERHTGQGECERRCPDQERRHRRRGAWHSADGGPALSHDRASIDLDLLRSKL